MTLRIVAARARNWSGWNDISRDTLSRSVRTSCLHEDCLCHCHCHCGWSDLIMLPPSLLVCGVRVIRFGGCSCSSGRVSKHKFAASSTLACHWYGYWYGYWYGCCRCAWTSQVRMSFCCYRTAIMDAAVFVASSDSVPSVVPSTSCPVPPEPIMITGLVVE